MSIRDKYRNWRLRKHVEKFGSKNNGYFNYFNREWFEEHQATLIFLLNHWLLKYWFRWILRIHKDCKFDEVIDEIRPNTYRISLGDNTYRSDFRTHQKFSKRIYYAFRPYWYLLHVLDFVIQRTVCPEFSFGFDTLTTYPDAGSGLTTVDGWAKYLNGYDTFTNMVNGLGNSNNSVTSNDYLSGLFAADSGYPNKYYHCYRSLYTFDTSIIGASGVISGAVFSIYIIALYYGLGNDPNVVIATSPTANNSIQNADFQNAFTSTTPLTDTRLSIQGSTTNAYKDANFNSSGITVINKTGITRLGLLSGWDFDKSFTGTWVATDRSCFHGAMSDTTGTTQDPKLVVTYTLPATGNKFQMVV